MVRSRRKFVFLLSALVLTCVCINIYFAIVDKGLWKNENVEVRSEDEEEEENYGEEEEEEEETEDEREDILCRFSSCCC